MTLQFGDELRNIIDIYKDGSEEPLDGDEADRLIEHLRNQANLMEGNITDEEYEELEERVPTTVIEHANKPLYQLVEEDFQEEAVETIGRRLTPEELNKVADRYGDSCEWAACVDACIQAEMDYQEKLKKSK